MTAATLARALVASWALSGAALADLLVVDPNGGGDFTSIQAAVDAAADGDFILIDDNNHSENVRIEGKGLTLFADPPGSFDLYGNVRVLGLSPTQAVRLVGLDIHAQVTLVEDLEESSGLYVSNSQGAVVAVDCVLHGGHGGGDLLMRGGPGVTLLGASNVVLVRSSVRAGEDSSVYACSWCHCQMPGIDSASSLLVQNSNIALYDCLVRGPYPDEACAGEAGNGGHAAEISSGTVYAASSHFEGGAGGKVVDWIEWGFAGDGGNAFHSVGPGHIRFLDTTFTPGAPGTAILGVPGEPGLGMVVTGPLNEFPGIARRLEAPALMHAGEDVELVFHGEEGDLAVGFTGTSSLYLILDTLAGILHYPLQTVVPIGAVPASGSIAQPLTIGPLAPGVAFPLDLQSIFLSAEGAVLLGSPSPALVLGP